MNQYSWDAILKHVAYRIGDESGVTVKPSDLLPPPKPDLGDIAFGCFGIAKQTGKNPVEIAKTLAEKLSKEDLTIEKVTAAGPYLNITVKTGELIARIVKDVSNYGEDFGSTDGGAKKVLMLEYAQPNTHKEIHVGHLRNLVLGASLVNLLQMSGWKTIAASYHGDVGAHVSKCLWFFVRNHASSINQPKPKKQKKGEPPFEPMSATAWTEHVLEHLDVQMADEMVKSVPKALRAGKYLGDLYAESSKVLEENPEWKMQVSAVQLKLEARDKGWMKLWQETRRWSIEEMNRIFQELGVSIDRQYFESEVVEEGQRMVDALLKKGVARESQGAIIVDLEEEKLGAFLIRKSDGTSLYATKDLALDGLKMGEYPTILRSLILVDNRQSLYFKQLFWTLKLMGSKTPHEFIGYEFVTLKSGAMSSREGNVVTWQGFRDEVLSFARKETLARHVDWTDGKIEHTSWCLAMGGIKFGMLKQDSDKIFTFDMERALSFDGDTGPYVQYAATRLNAILKKAGWNPETGWEAGDASTLGHPMEKRLALKIAALPEVCRKSAEELRPMILAQWCIGMAQTVSDFYRDVHVLEAPFGVKQARLALVAAARDALVIALSKLGIPVPEEM